jgi:NAD(P)-dependent dehydrogenase (short-subunit alcohol dehydrogenase family)
MGCSGGGSEQGGGIIALMQPKIVLITGANGGLGTNVTQAFLDSGATVIGVSPSIKPDAFESQSFTAMPAEITNGASANRLVGDVIEKFRRVDVLVHLVGAFAGGKSLQETDESVFNRMIDLNLRSAFLMIAAVLPHMRKQHAGRILAIGSKAAVEPAPMAAVYAASKAALIEIIRSIAAENKDAGISANIVLPGTMDTPANRAAMPAADPSKWVQPAQVAQLLVSLASDGLSQVNGAVIPIYGSEG